MAAGTGTVNFDGELTQNTCDVSIGGQGSDATIVLPTVNVSLLQTAAQTAGLQTFILRTSNCNPDMWTYAAFFEAGPTVDTLTGRLKNTNKTGATNVSLQLVDPLAQKPIQAGNQNQVANNTYYRPNNLAYAVQYYAEGPTTPGLVNSSVVYSLMYK
ncbi:fimbrial protein [Pantoea sp. EA-12]|uniref:fimbrial protein n=1 Tax=Pantoea sp. EA-12 TaxID=3043303 RepID=UPI0024B51DD5|nr:fimbrial protein [Pantoea sp. EA-12]